MGDPVVLVVDADRPSARAVIESLTAAGVGVVVGARDQLRLATVADAGRGRVTVPVADAVDAEVILATVHDAMGPLRAVVVVVQPGEGKAETRVAGVAEAMAISIGLSAACTTRDVPLHVVGPGAAAVVAWLEEEGGTSVHLGIPGQEEEPTRRRDRVAGQARRFARRVLGRGP